MTDHIHVGTAAPRIQYVASGTQTAFTFPFPIFTAADLEVWLGNTRQVSPAYSLSGIGISAGGTVLFASPPAPGILVTLRRHIAIARISDYQDDGIIRAKTLNDELDFQTAAIQQVAEDVGRAVRRSFLSSNTADLTLPEPVAGRAVKWNAAGTGLENSDADADAVLTAAAADRAIVASDKAIVASDKTAAAASAAAAHTSEVAAAASAAAASAAASGGTVKITASDTTSDYLSASLSAGANIALSVLNPGANETLRISASGLAVVATSGLYSDLTGKPSLGSVAPLDVDTDTALSANSDSKIASQKAVKAYVAANGGVSTVEFSALQQDVIQNYLLDAVNGAWAAGSYSNGGYDAFNSDTIGSTSTNQTYDGTNKLYGNPGGNTMVPGATGTPIGTMTSGGGLAAGFDGNTNQSVAASAPTIIADPAYIGKDWGAGNTKVVSQAIVWSFSGNSGFDGEGSGATTITLSLVGSNGSDPTVATDLGGAITFSDVTTNTSKTITPTSTTAYRYHWLKVVSSAGGGSYHGVSELQFYTASSPLNMTLVSSALVPAPVSAPTQIKLMVLYKAIDTSTLNTDFTVEATRDGTTWTVGTLTDTGLTISGFKVLWAVIDVSAQPSGISVKYRIKTLNAKSQQAKAVALMTK